MSTFPEPAQPAPADPSAGERAARLANFKREQLIVDTLNRGVSVAEIAARFDVGEKRMRATIRDPRTGIRGLARREPHPPEAFVAIQVSRLNEALLVAYSAMSGTNLKAVDRVVKIVRELNRYHGFAAAGRRRSEPERLGAPAEGTATYGSALICSARFAAECAEEIEFEPNARLPLAPLQRREVMPACGGADDHRPQNPSQCIEKVESAPGIARRPNKGIVAALRLSERKRRDRRPRPQNGVRLLA
jgi:hypothetical protein